MEPQELMIEDRVKDYLERLDIYPFSLIFTYSANSDGLLSITFFLQQDLDSFLKQIDYQIQCDKSGYVLIRETNTLLLSGLALINLYTRL